MHTTNIANCRTIIVLNPEKFRADFFDWFAKNHEIFTRFEIEANKLRAAGRSHYGHRTIWEFLRHETALRDSDGDFKMNDHYTKGCAQLYMLAHPDAGSFFRFREVSPAEMARAA